MSSGSRTETDVEISDHQDNNCITSISMCYKSAFIPTWIEDQFFKHIMSVQKTSDDEKRDWRAKGDALLARGKENEAHSCCLQMAALWTRLLWHMLRPAKDCLETVATHTHKRARPGVQ